MVFGEPIAYSAVRMLCWAVVFGVWGLDWYRHRSIKVRPSEPELFPKSGFDFNTRIIGTEVSSVSDYWCQFWNGTIDRARELLSRHSVRKCKSRLFVATLVQTLSLV